MRALAPLPHVVTSFKQPGRPPVLDWLPIAALRIDGDYQRPLTTRGLRTINAICRQFSWSKFSAVVVARIPGASELWAIIDGQHRATAALSLGYDRVPCMIVDAQQGEQAAIFAAINGTVTPMHVQVLYKAALLAGEPWAVTVDRVTKAAGLTVLTHPVQKTKLKPFQTNAVGTLRQSLALYGEARLAKGLKKAVRQPGADEPGHWCSDVIRNAARDASAVSEPERPGVAPDDIIALKARGFTRQQIAAQLHCSYAEVDAALSGGSR